MREASFVAVLLGSFAGSSLGLPRREVDSRVECSEQLPRYKAAHSSQITHQ
jgi:hypothetical protein